MRYIIGIDLGTTNSCVAYVDMQNPQQSIQPFRIPQLKDAGYIEAQATLPSFCYLAAPHEWPSGSLDLPWKKNPEYCVGALALSQGAKVPTRLVQSAKSWLCHSAANRRDKILPFEAADDSQRLSPIEASSRYLNHIKEAWNHLMASGDPDAEFQEQDIILTVPASFDEVARTLTIEAARAAGLKSLTLLEEPQAAFYCWISHHEKIWPQRLHAGDTIVVCDVGGGTTDFSLIEVTSKDDILSFQRMAVGDHLLLGGDNMDAALAHALESKLSIECSSQQWAQLRHLAREAKEVLLGPKAPTSYRVHLQGSGSSVIQGSHSADISRDEVLDLLEQGFFGSYSWKDALHLRKGSGLRTMGLPYEEEPSIVKHLAHFLHQSGDAQPEYVLFNGGTMKPAAFRQSILNALKTWFPENTTLELDSQNLDLAVSRGAAYYGKARRGAGVRIGGGTARGYYLAVDVQGQQKALTLLPRGSEDGSAYESEQTFWVTPNTPVAFRLLSSHVRLHDVQGRFVDIDPEQMQTLAPIHTIIRFGKGMTSEISKEKIPVHLAIKLTPIGTLALWLKSQKSEHTWSLEFQMRTATGQDNALAALDQGRRDETFDHSLLIQPKQLIAAFYSGKSPLKPAKLMEHLETSLQRPRQEWSSSLLRGLWEEVNHHAGRRKANMELEKRWWYLAGFLLRPGYGYPLDDFRVKELWKVILADLKGPRPDESQVQMWICYRRIAGGLNKGQQTQIANELLPGLLSKNGKIELKNKNEQYYYTEKLRTLAALELLDQPLKIKLGNALLTRMEQQSLPAELWALGRLGARHLMHGTLAHVIPKETCCHWVDRLLTFKNCDAEQLIFTIGHLARKTSHREINLSQAYLDRIVKHFEHSPQAPRLHALLFDDTNLTQNEQDQLFGEHLPLGLSLDQS